MRHSHHPHHQHHGPRHRRDEFGFPPFGPGFGPRGRGGRKRMRRGDVRAAILVLLAEEPRNGYQLMQEIETRSDGAWRPSPGSVYPALQQLEDEGLVQAQKSEGRKAFALTDEGTAHVEQNREKLGEPWAGLGPEFTGAAGEYWKQFKPLMEAVKQVGMVGDEDAIARGSEVLADARRKLYAILAEDRATA